MKWLLGIAKAWILSRAKEPSTWMGIILTIFGGATSAISEDQMTQLASTAAMICGIILTGKNEQKPVEKAVQKVLHEDRPWLDDKIREAYDAGVRAGLNANKEQK